MCEPVTLSLLAGGLAGGGAYLGGASLIAAAGTALLGGITAYSGMQSAEHAYESAVFQAEGHAIAADEMMKQIEVAEAQSLQEELMRRDEFTYVTSKNLAATTVTGARTGNEMFAAIQERNEKRQRQDQAIADLNLANKKGQLAGQAQQHGRAVFAAIRGGENARTSGYIDTMIGLVDNFPLTNFAEIGAARQGSSSGVTNPSKSLLERVNKAVS